MNSKFYGHLVYLLVHNLVTYPEEKHLGTKIHLRKHTQHAKARNSEKVQPTVRLVSKAMLHLHHLGHKAN